MAHLDGGEKLGDLASVYREVYAEPPYNAGPLWSAESFIERTRRQTARDGFSFIAANDDDDVPVGFAFGLTFLRGHGGRAMRPRHPRRS